MIFNQQNFLISSILLDILLSEKSIFHPAGDFLIKCALTDPKSNCLPLKFPKS